MDPAGDLNAGAGLVLDGFLHLWNSALRRTGLACLRLRVHGLHSGGHPLDLAISRAGP